MFLSLALSWGVNGGLSGVLWAKYPLATMSSLCYWANPSSSAVSVKFPLPHWFLFALIYPSKFLLKVTISVGWAAIVWALVNPEGISAKSGIKGKAGPT